MEKDLFYTVMEADGDLLEPFTPSEDPQPEMTDQQQGQTNEQPPADMGAEDLPPEPGGGMEDLGLDETGGDMENQGEDQEDPNAQQEDQHLAEKSNEILNQNLYSAWLNLNQDIENTLTNLQAMTPCLPCDVVDQNDKSINRMNRMFESSKDYVLNKFVQMSYGENLIQYQRLTTLYTLLRNEIDSVLKKFNDDSQ